MLSYKRITFTLKRYVETLNKNDNKRKPQCSLSRVKPNVNQLWLLLHIYIIQQPKLSARVRTFTANPNRKLQSLLLSFTVKEFNI